MTEPNPYQSPKSEASPARGLFKHRSCPVCGAKVPWTRFWVKSYIWARWPCEACGALLRFSLARRLAAVTLALVGMAPFVALAAYVQIELLVNSFTQIAVVIAVFLAIFALICIGCMLIDGVVLASPNQRDDPPKRE